MRRELLVAICVLTFAGCKDARTELILGVATDLKATGDLDAVHLSLAVEGVVFHEETWPITGSPAADFNLPGSFGIFKDGSHDRVEIKLTGLKAGVMRVERVAVLGFVDGRTTFYRMGLTAACMANTCPSGMTCVEGSCVSPMVDPTMFPKFDGELVTTLTCKTTMTAPYISTADNIPMPVSADAALCPGSLCREGTCLVPPTTGCDNCREGQVCIDGMCQDASPQNSCALRNPSCCPAQDNSCTAPGESCFCDEACVGIGDCCPDACQTCGFCNP